ncbi:putative leucine-rich repeat domain superfamily [Dioscorea sansibarensis]
MVKFSCFASPLQYQKSKKATQQFDGATQSNSKVISQDKGLKTSTASVDSKAKVEFNNASSSSAERITIPSSFESCWKTGDLQSDSCVEGSSEFLLMGGLKKSVSLGNVLDKGRDFSCDDITEDEAQSPKRIMDRHIDSSRHTDSAESNEHGDFAVAHNQHESLFSVGVTKRLDEDMPDHSCEHSANHSIESPHLSADTPTGLVKSRSLAHLRVDSDSSTDAALLHELTVPRSKSFENLNLLNELNGEHSPHRADYGTMVGCNEVDIQDGDGSYLNEKNKSEYRSVAGGDFHKGNCLVNDSGENTMYDGEMRGTLQQVSCMQNCDDLTSDELKIKRIEEWISQIEIPSGFSVEELGKGSDTASKKDSHAAAGGSPGKPDARNSAGMEVASAYISSLSPAATSAQITNLGLVSVPILSSFVGLKVLNLSGNAIVRINAGVLPKSLQMLNLSKNNMAVIEGLRDLTRLRVLDLSFNRISRIGHGLASCSSLKELNLAGNKISEVEGLHRLLKLYFLDLRFNKISTSKGLGQLAANTSLQAINLEGNPAQRNVGDEQLKKYLLSLLPNLVYFNKQTTRASSSKEVASLQFERELRTSHKNTRRTHGSGLHKGSTVSSSSHALGSLPKHSSKGRHEHIGSARTKTANHLRNVNTKPLGLQPTDVIRRIRSEGAFREH